MIIALQAAAYVAFAVLLTFGGNVVCRWVLRASATRAPAEIEQTITLRAGRVIGLLERLLIFVGLVGSSWEILASVIALKTVARYSKLDEQNNAEYFLVGSLASILWAVVMTGAIVLFDRGAGFGALAQLMGLFDNPMQAHG